MKRGATTVYYAQNRPKVKLGEHAVNDGLNRRAVGAALEVFHQHAHELISLRFIGNAERLRFGCCSGDYLVLRHLCGEHGLNDSELLLFAYSQFGAAAGLELLYRAFAPFGG